jgi:Ca2+/Na+ antiporter
MLTYSAIIGVLLGAWFIWKPPEISIQGLKGIGKHLKISQYTAGTLSSLASNVPEAVIVGLAFYRSWVSGNMELMEIGLIMVLATIGMNLILLGIVVIVGAKEGYVDIPKEALEYDMELYRFIFVAIFALFAYFVAHAFFLIGQGVQLSVKIPWYFSLLLFVSYPLYLWLSPKSASGIVESDLPLSKSLIYFIFGNLGILLGGELIVSNVEEILLHMRDQIATFVDPIVLVAIVLAVLGAIPEHFVAVKAAVRGEVDIALGNLLGGISQIILLILAGIGIFIEIPLDKYTLFQLILVALQFWFIKRSILDDQKLDSFEGAMILLFQILAFVLLLAS